ncbi:MAG: hypothetical protein VKS61_18175 [Candidatus Sericytochromatia bacterium]|nr:hypothetical protein [Candidatus Sericytochromatia bacterium]
MPQPTCRGGLLGLAATLALAAPASASPGPTPPPPGLSPPPSLTCSGYPARRLHFKSVPVWGPAPLPPTLRVWPVGPGQGSEAPGQLSVRPGEVTLLVAWSVRMPDHRTRLREAGALARELGPRGVRIVGLSLDRPGGGPDGAPDPAWRHWARAVGGACFRGDAAAAEALGGLPSLPTTIVVGRDGLVAGRIVGALAKSHLDDLLGVW